MNLAFLCLNLHEFNMVGIIRLYLISITEETVYSLHKLVYLIHSFVVPLLKLFSERWCRNQGTTPPLNPWMMSVTPCRGLQTSFNIEKDLYYSLKGLQFVRLAFFFINITWLADVSFAECCEMQDEGFSAVKLQFFLNLVVSSASSSSSYCVYYFVLSLALIIE